MKGFKDHINLIENYIGELLKGLNDNPVYDPVKYFLKLPSKRVRPVSYTHLTLPTILRV